MNFKLIIGYPLWFVILCLLLGVGYAAILYFRESKNEFSFVLKGILAMLRTVFIALIAFLLLNPLIKNVSQYSEKPVIIFAQDNSSSITRNLDSAFYKTEYNSLVNGFLEKIENSFSVDKYTFGEEVKREFEVDFNDKMTDASGLFSEIIDKYSHRNVGALIIASDGIINRGLNPLYLADKFSFPFYTVALGDTNFQRDVILTRVNFNRLAYFGNEFPLEVLITAKKCKDQSIQLRISKNDTVLFRKSLLIQSDNYFETVNLYLKADVKGLQRYHLSIDNIDNEISYENNYQDIFIDILEGKQKILLLAQSPSPDISALKQAVKENINYEIEDFIIEDFDRSVQEYDLLILHGLPSAKNTISNVIDKSNTAGIPILYILTQQTSLDVFNLLNAGLAIKANKTSYNEALPSINENFALFRLSGTTSKAISYFPPLLSPYGNYLVQPSSQVLLYQKIGAVSTELPLIALNESQNGKAGFIVGNGIWKWRMINYAKESNHNGFNEIITKIIQYLSVKADRSFFRIYTKTSYVENESVEFDAELYNDNYELINDAEVSITITDSEKNKYPYVFNQTDKAYHLNAGKLPVGYYSFSARVNIKDKVFTDNGEFTISALNIEKTNTVANHNLLYNLALNRGGQMVYPENINDLIKLLEEREDIKPVVYHQLRYTEIINYPLILMLVILLISAEWFMRKRAGGY